MTQSPAAAPSDAAAQLRMVSAERDAAVVARDAALADRDEAVVARDAAVAERDVAVAERDAAAAERDAAVAASLRARQIMRSFAHSVDLGLLFLDDTGAVAIANDAYLGMRRLADYDPAVGGGNRVFDADQVTPMPPAQQPLDRLRRGETIEHMLLWVGPRGAQRALIANGRPVFDDGRGFVGSMLVVQDVTDVIRSTRAREDALATLAHELRTPLTSIVGYADLLAEELSSSAAHRAKAIQRNSERLLTLTSEFLDGLHRRAEVNLERFDLRDLVEQAVDALLPAVGEREVVIEVDSGLDVVADRDGMSVVLGNLLSNAVAFSRPFDRIVVAAGADTRVWLRVHNTGSRIDREDLERVFDRFYRGGNAERAGLGVGLSISRDILAAHRGTLAADAVDDGASFTLTLPRE